MLTVILPKDLEDSLTKISKEMEISQNQIVIDALKQYIENKIDYCIANKVYQANNKCYTHEQVLCELEL